MSTDSSQTRELHVRERAATSASVTTSPRVKPAPAKDAIPVPFDYASSDDGTDENLLILLHGLGEFICLKNFGEKTHGAQRVRRYQPL